MSNRMFNKTILQLILLKPRSRGLSPVASGSWTNHTRSCHHQQSPVIKNVSLDPELSSTSSLEDQYDIIINGGGIVGFSMFAAIKSSPFLSTRRVLLIEQQSPPKLASIDSNLESSSRQFSNRVSSITLASKQFFEQLKIWDSLRPFAKQVSGMYVWSDHYQNGINFRQDIYEGAMCYILENNRMLQSLQQKINSEANSLQKIFYKTSVIDINQNVNPLNSNQTEIQLKVIDINDPEQRTKTLKTKLLIGCDGFKSIVRSKSTLPYFELDLDQNGIVGTLEVESQHLGNQVAFQRFLDDDVVIALLPLDERYSSLVLSLPKRQVPEWMSLSDEDFVQRLQNELIKETKIQSPLDKLASTFNLSQLYGQVQVRSPPFIRSIVPGSRASFPLGFGTTVPFLVGTIQTKVPLLQALINKEKRVNTAIIGDAAHRVHPLAGQGLNLGLGDAATLAQCLDAKLSCGYELFATTSDSSEVLSQALYEFERTRVMKLVPMLGAIHSMQTLFRYTPSAILPVVNQMELAKQLIVSFANSR